MQQHINQNRNSMPVPGGYTANPEMAQAVEASATFQALNNQVQHAREVQAERFNYTYTVSGTVASQVTTPFTITIEQGSDFQSLFLTGSAFSYDAANASIFPMPNSAGSTAWSGRGLSIQITDANAGRLLTSGFVALENLLTPGYGQNFQQPFSFRYHFRRNSKIRFDVRNRETNASRAVQNFEINLNGFKVLTPN